MNANDTAGRDPWVVSMIGSREHYLPPRALRRRGLLRRFYTDVWWPRGRALLSRGPAAARRLAGRFHPDLPSDQVTAFNVAGLFDLATYGLAKLADPQRRYAFFLTQGSRFARRVAHDLRATGLDREAGVFLGFKTASLETLEALQGSPVRTVLGQFDAALEHFAVIEEEHRRWPGWSASPPRLPDDLVRRWTAEWRLADVIYVNSEWTRQALIKQGVPDPKIAVGPLAYERSPGSSPRPAHPHRGPLRVLWVAGVTLGKGIQYLVAAANALDSARFRFTVAGAIGVTQDALATAPSNMRFLGLVPRAEVPALYRDADLFVLPTLSDGFAITQLEAMAHGLAVVATPRCGRVVTDGHDGLLVPPGDPDALAAALDRLERDRDELASMSRAAAQTVRAFTTDAYTDGLLAAIRGRPVA